MGAAQLKTKMGTELRRQREKEQQQQQLLARQEKICLRRVLTVRKQKARQGPPLTRSTRRRRRRNTRSTRRRRRSIRRRRGQGMTATARERELMAMLKIRQIVAEVLRSLQGPQSLRMNEPDCWIVDSCLHLAMGCARVYPMCCSC